MAQPLIGWWMFEAGQAGIVHATTGQALRHLGVAQPETALPRSRNRIWMVFSYRDPDIELPLLVEWRNVPSAADKSRPLVWRVDYVRSALLWAAKTHAAQPCPSYGLWRRIDDFLTDALACWPAHAVTGAKPGRIAFNGGWLNGRWTSELYRCVWESTHLVMTTDAFQVAELGPLTTPAPSPWRSVAVGIENSPSLNIDNAKSWPGARGAMSVQPSLASEDGRRLLVALPKAEGVRWSLRGLSRLFYADEKIVSDLIHVGIWDHRPHELPTWSVRFETVGSHELFDRVTMETIAPLRSNSTVPGSERSIPGGLVDHARYLPLTLQRRLAHGCIDAWLLQSDPSWSFSSTAEIDAALARSAMASIDWKLAGSVMPSRLEALNTLAPDIGGKPNPLAFMFDEEKDGIERVSTAFVTTGFWQFDPAARSLVNLRSGQKLRFCERIDFAAAGITRLGNGEGWRFQYEDGGLSYPLVVFQETSSTMGVLSARWLLDHQQSKALWRREGGDEIPAFGLWQRINECATDALLCWPEIEETGQPPTRVTSIAGWQNGGWSTVIRRERDRGLDLFFAERGGPEQPYLEDADASAHAWHFLDTPRAESGAALAGVQMLAPHRLHLPADARLTGYERQVPHLVRGDGRAVIFPAGVRSHMHRGEDYVAEAIITYADEELFFSVTGKAFAGWQTFPSKWTFKVGQPFRIGLRQLDRFDAVQPDGVPESFFWRKPPAFVVPFRSDHAGGIPSAELAQRITTALVDGWFAWAGVPKRMRDDADHLRELGAMHPRGRVPSLAESGIDLSQTSQVRVEGAYIGGRFNERASTTAWLEKHTTG